MKLNIKKLCPEAVIPKRATKGSAGFDISACVETDIVIKPGEIKLIPTGLSAALECENASLLLYPRSGLASKNGISLANCVGVVDSDYRGEIKVALINHGDKEFTVTQGMRIAQLVVTPIIIPQICETDTLDETERSSGGFGSTGQ